MSEEPSCSIVIICGTRRLRDGEKNVAVFISGARSLRISIIFVHLICITLCDDFTSSSYIDCVWTATMACSYSLMTCENINTPLVSLYHFLWLFLDTLPSIVYTLYPSCERSRQIFRVYRFFHCWIWIHLHYVMILNLCYTIYKGQYCCTVRSTLRPGCAVCHQSHMPLFMAIKMKSLVVLVAEKVFLQSNHSRKLSEVSMFGWLWLKVAVVCLIVGM